MSTSLLHDLEIAESFLAETRELMATIDRGLARLARAPADRALVDDLFRAVHTVKGTSGFMGLEQMSTLSHQMEDVFVALRRGHLEVDASVMEVLYAGYDAMQALLRRFGDGREEAIDLGPLLAALRTTSTGLPAGPSAQIDASPRAAVPPRTRIAEPPDGVHIPHPAGAFRPSFGGTRRIPIASTLCRYDRVVRDLGRSLGKDVDLAIDDDGVEIDDALAEALHDVLVHLLRNACDHGIEPPRVREARGKPAAGTIRLAASIEGGCLCLVVEDDGAGLDPDRLRHAAVAGGLAGEEEASGMTDEEARALIFRPGLTTARRLSAVSGRGVGLDVVAARVAGLDGRISLHAEAGRGTRFTIRLPAA